MVNPCPSTHWSPDEMEIVAKQIVCNVRVNY